MNELLTTNQVADELQLHINTVWQYILTGKLKGFKLGAGGRYDRWRIRREDLDDFLKGAGERATGDTQK